MTSELSLLAVKHKTDKSMLFNKYTERYHEAITAHLNRESVKGVCEIGIGHIFCMDHVARDYRPGASLRMWEEYFPNAQIYGMDYVEDILFEEGRIKCILTNQGYEHLLREAFSKCNGPLDLIVDDGSHILEHQLNTKNICGDYLRSGGLMIIEDIDSRYLIREFAEPPEGFEMIMNNPDDNPTSSFVIYRKL
jgi:hypothetical protein